ncbi:hypothetical protein Bhyg_14095 [Pseudolycoriella hygida]|uniref:Uncharacterized protein n=1 Tax=Pseudolycoriella hygida TaxID=35572 RepID=A0A9Q0MRC4_9DIPT|nr:hypothetical protein Bhyg_14095 [Pseudolycoriella hygida]
MSDNEDLLTYEIGDIDVHDNADDLDAVEDELLMSDDEPNLEDENLSATAKTSRTLTDENKRISPAVDTVSPTEKTPKKRTLKRNVGVPVNSQIPKKLVKHVTDKHLPEITKQESQSNEGATKECASEIPKNENEISAFVTKPVALPVTSTEIVENTYTCPVSDKKCSVNTTTSQDESHSCVEESENESVSLTQQSQDSSVINSQSESAVTDDLDSDYNKHKVDTELEDSDDCTERMNAKLCVERDIGHEMQVDQLRPTFYKSQRGALSPRSNAVPRQNYQPQFNSFGPRPNNMQFHPRYGPPALIPPHQNSQIGPRMEYRGMPPLNFRPPFQNNLPRLGNHPHFQPHAHAVNRPNFPPNGPPNALQYSSYINNSQPNPQMMGHFEANGTMGYPPRPPFGCSTAPFVGPARHETPAPHIVRPGPPIVPRKVLINPNFKGGVQAATNQLMMDTMGNPQFMSAQSDAELLRQQEAFINKNRMHIEKRRYERSPDRDRDRERSYSPPRRERRYSRERETRKQVYNRGGRDQRLGSREPPNRPLTKRRRSFSLERDKSNKQDEPEDEETIRYRLEIEKQKSMREKILRDKEMRRRQAAEEKTNNEEKKPVDEPAAKLTPIIVTEKKIISLKKKSDVGSSSVGQRVVGKSLPDTKKADTPSDATTISKSVKSPLKLHTANQRLSDLEDYDEDELLADSPTPPAPVPATITGGMFTNRKVVLTTTTTSTVDRQKLALRKNSTSKGIFDRLDVKIGVNEAAKQKIQKIVLKSND